MFVVVLVVLVVLVLVGATAALLVVRSRRKPADNALVSSADRIQGSFAAVAPAEVAAPEPATAAPDNGKRPQAEQEGDEPEEDEILAARFRLPGERSVARLDTDIEIEIEVVPTVVRHLEPIEAAPVEPEPPAVEAAAIDDAPTVVDDVVRSLIERVRDSDDDMMSVVSEMVERDLDTAQMEEVLTELVERDGSARARRDELTLSGPDVPQRPGRLRAFADMPEAQKRRVIIRVPCLLIARSEEQEPITEIDDRPEYTVTLPDDESTAAASEPTARDLWGEPETDARETHLPARRLRLARTRR